MKKIKISYDGKYPCLCMGHLVVNIDGKDYDFGKYVLESGGSCGFEDRTYENSFVNKGPWEITDWPDDFPDDEDLKKQVLEEVNTTIPWGCCGGCL